MKNAWMLGLVLGAMMMGSFSELRSGVASSLRSERSNLAAGKPVDFAVRPTYALTADEGDALQLTDGRLASQESWMWVDRLAVGWQREDPVIFTVDLQERQPISGVALHLAAGRAGVEWPSRMLVFVDDEQGRFHQVGDVVADATDRPTVAGYTADWWALEGLETHARRVAFLISPGGPWRFLMMDEIEIYGGDRTWLTQPHTGPGVTDLNRYSLESRVRERLTRDLAEVGAAIETLDLPVQTHEAFEQKIQQVRAAVQTPEAAELPAGEAVILPLNPVHRQMMAVYGQALAASGEPALRLTSENPYDLPRFVDQPVREPAPAEVVTMRGEVRPVVVRLQNTTGQDAQVTLRVTDLDPSLTPEQVYEVKWTDTADLQVVASALVALEEQSGAYAVAIPAGTGVQVWFSFRPAMDARAGEHHGRITAEVAGEVFALPLKVRVFDLDYPSEHRLHVGGWDYTDSRSQYGVSPRNREALVQLLKSYGVDTPWATSAMLRPGRYDAEGGQIDSPDFSTFDQWVARWPEARRYAIFLNLGDDIGGHAPQSAAGRRAVREWLQSFADHAQALGVNPERILLLTQDEPRTAAMMVAAEAWGRAIAEAGTGLKTWLDPLYGFEGVDFPDAGAAEVYDILCVNRHQYFLHGDRHLATFLEARDQGKTLEVYSCEGPTVTFDPYVYYRLQAWFCFDLGANASSFWAFGDNGGRSDWQTYGRSVISYTPIFLDENFVTPAKGIEAIRAGTQDYQYLVQLQEGVASLKEQGRSREAREGRDLLEEAVRNVLGSYAIQDYAWTEPADRSVADAYRVKIGAFLETAGSATSVSR